MRTTLFLLGMLILRPMLCRAAPPGATFTVATNGDDHWSGRLASPNGSRTDGPFATLQRAQQAVRAQRKSGDSQPLVVNLRGGTYYLKTPLVFTAEDSGPSAQGRTTYGAMTGEKPVISGGEPVTGWKPDAQGHWQTTLPEVKSGKWYFSQMFAGDQRRFRPRLPKQGYAFVAGALPPSAKSQGKGFDQFRFATGDFHADWHNVNDVETLCFQIWSMARFRVVNIDEPSRTVRFMGDTRNTEAYTALSKGKRYIVENVREALRDPGEWYLDRNTGALTYIPMPGETPEKTVVIAPRLESLVELRGDVAKRAWVQNIRFFGLTFAHTNWNCPAEGNASAQAEVNLGAAISAVGARNCVWDHCTVAHTGTYGMEWGEGCRDNALLASNLFDLGAGGVKIGTQGVPADAEGLASHNRVYDCRIAQAGRLHPAGVGVWIGHSPDNEIAHNDIHDLYYSGLSVGWSWGYGPSGAHGNHLDDNRIWQIGQGVLSDMGGIYTLGLAPGTTERGNVIHDIESFDYGGWGIYPDEGSTGLLIENNLVYRTKTGGFHQHYGKDNVVRNNIFAFSREGQIIRTRAEDHRSFTFEHNIVYFKEGTLLGSNWTGDGFALDNNLYWNAAGQPLDFAGMTLAEWQKRGHDLHSLVADPLFIAPEKGDFSLKRGSPALTLGFQPFDTSRAGTVTKRAPLLAALRAFPAPAPPLPPQPIVVDFEATPVGAKMEDGTTSEENDRATVRVTDETAASGKHSLKFIDVPGQKFSYSPHVFLSPNLQTGLLRGSFSLRLEPGAIFTHEWRDNANPYHVGPSIRITADGILTANGRKLTKVPHSRWISIQIECGLGAQAAGRYTLSISFGGRTPPMLFDDLTCGKEFRKLTWWGFVSDADADTVLYIDDLRLTPQK